MILAIEIKLNNDERAYQVVNLHNNFPRSRTTNQPFSDMHCIPQLLLVRQTISRVADSITAELVAELGIGRVDIHVRTNTIQEVAVRDIQGKHESDATDDSTRNGRVLRNRDVDGSHLMLDS